MYDHGFERIHRAYRQIGAELGIGQPLPPPQQIPSLVVVPVQGLSRLTREGVSAGLSLGDKVVAVTVCYDNPDKVEDQQHHARFDAAWHAWDPDVPLVTLHSPKRTLGPPIVDYLRAKEVEDPHRRIVALIPEVQPEHWWRWFLHNQRGAVLNRAIMNGTDNVVICRLRFRLAHLSPDEQPGTVPAERA